MTPRRGCDESTTRDRPRLTLDDEVARGSLVGGDADVGDAPETGPRPTDVFTPPPHVH